MKPRTDQEMARVTRKMNERYGPARLLYQTEDQQECVAIAFAPAKDLLLLCRMNDQTTPNWHVAEVPVDSFTQWADAKVIGRAREATDYWEDFTTEWNKHSHCLVLWRGYVHGSSRVVVWDPQEQALVSCRRDATCNPQLVRAMVGVAEFSQFAEDGLFP